MTFELLLGEMIRRFPQTSYMNECYDSKGHLLSVHCDIITGSHVPVPVECSYKTWFWIRSKEETMVAEWSFYSQSNPSPGYVTWQRHGNENWERVRGRGKFKPWWGFCFNQFESDSLDMVLAYREQWLRTLRREAAAW